MKTQEENTHGQVEEKGLERPSEGANPTDTSVSGFQPPDCEMIRFSCSSHPVCSTLLQQPQQTNVI